MKKKSPLRRVDVNVELDRIIDRAKSVPLSEWDSQKKLKTALHALGRATPAAAQTEKTSSVLGDEKNADRKDSQPITAVLLGGRFTALDADAWPQPPDGKLREVEQANRPLREAKGTPLSGKGPRQPALFEEALKGSKCRLDQNMSRKEVAVLD